MYLSDLKVPSFLYLSSVISMGTTHTTSKPYTSPIRKLEMSAQVVHKEVGFGIERLIQLSPTPIPSMIRK
jgi:hypothetical protein